LLSGVSRVDLDPTDCIVIEILSFGRKRKKGTTMVTFAETIKFAVRQIAPPSLYSAVSLWRASRRSLQAAERPHVPQPLSCSPRPSFRAAQEDAGRSYNDPNLCGAFSDQVPLDDLRDFDAPILAAVALAALRKKGAEINVLDFGGGAGRMKAVVSSYFKESVEERWTVVEAEEQVAANEGVKSSKIRFLREIEPLRYDLALFSGSLRYLSDWKTPLAAASQSDLIMICRTPFSDREQPFVQSVARDGYIYKLAARVIAKDEIAAALSPTHNLLASWKLEQHLFEMGVYESPSILWQRKIL